MTLSDREVKITKIIVDVNDLVPFRLSSDDLIHWAKDIERLSPDADLNKMKFLMDAFKEEKIVYDKNKGIQNIFNGLKRIRLNDDNTYEILKEIW